MKQAFLVPGCLSPSPLLLKKETSVEEALAEMYLGA
jgi:hypothetical protein